MSPEPLSKGCEMIVSERHWRVSWGERAVEIARKAGVEKLPSVLHEPVEEILTRS
jgi:hypothetical protein